MKNITNIAGILLIITTTLNPIPQVHAEGGGSMAGGGGDAACEMRINEIRADILKWVNEGGHQKLQYSGRLNASDYETGMRYVLAPQAVIVGCVTSKEEEVTQDPELKVRVDGVPKACRGFVSQRDNARHIVCNLDRFNPMTQSEQYRQIHHEYAGLVNIEINRGAASDYSYSTQITDYLKPVTILRLALKKEDPLTVSDRDFREQPYNIDNGKARVEHPLQAQIVAGVALTTQGNWGGTIQGKAGYGSVVVMSQGTYTEGFSNGKGNNTISTVKADLEIRIDKLTESPGVTRFELKGPGIGTLSFQQMDALHKSTGRETVISKGGIELFSINLDLRLDQLNGINHYGEVTFFNPDLNVTVGNTRNFVTIGAGGSVGVQAVKIGNGDATAAGIAQANLLVRVKLDGIGIFTGKSEVKHGRAPYPRDAGDDPKNDQKYTAYIHSITASMLRNSPLTFTIQLEQDEVTDPTGTRQNTQVNFLGGFGF